MYCKCSKERGNPAETRYTFSLIAVCQSRLTGRSERTHTNTVLSNHRPTIVVHFLNWVHMNRTPDQPFYVDSAMVCKCAPKFGKQCSHHPNELNSNVNWICVWTKSASRAPKMKMRILLWQLADVKLRLLHFILFQLMLILSN